MSIFKNFDSNDIDVNLFYSCILPEKKNERKEKCFSITVFDVM